MPLKKEVKSGGAPEWVLTYGDMMSLLLCFFIMLAAMSEIKEEKKFKAVSEAIQRAFGYSGGVGPIQSNEPIRSLMEKLEKDKLPQGSRVGDAAVQGLEGKLFRITQIREGIRISLGGQLAFDRFSADLEPDARDPLAKLAREISGYTTKLEIRGHTSIEPLPPDCLFKRHSDLAYARARAVADELIKHGVDDRRIRMAACGPWEPIKIRAYSEQEHALNRRVEIIVNESTVSDFIEDDDGG